MMQRSRDAGEGRRSGRRREPCIGGGRGGVGTRRAADEAPPWSPLSCYPREPARSAPRQLPRLTMAGAALPKGARAVGTKDVATAPAPASHGGSRC